MPPTSANLVTNIALVAAGGAVGSVVRYAINGLGIAIAGKQFPAGTLVANLLGCLIIGVLLFFVMDRNQPSEPVRLLVITGFLGGLTTFSSFGSETVQLFLLGSPGRAVVNVAANVVFGLAAVALGYTLARAAA